MELRLLSLILIAVLPASTSRSQGTNAELAAHEAFFFTPPGFDREGQPMWASGGNTGQVRIVVRDLATGNVTPCRVNVVGPDGNFYQPTANRLSPYALTGQWPKPNNWGNRFGKAPYRYVGRFFYTTGESTVAVPPGAARVEVWKGYEYRPETITIQVEAGRTATVDVGLTRTAPMEAEGYHAGDSHLHFRRETEAQDEIMFDLLEAEDFRYGVALAYNEPQGPYAGFMNTLDYPQRLPLGRQSIRTRGNYHIMSGQEYRTGTYGHLNLYLLDELVFPGERFNADDWPVYGEVARDARAQGGFTMMAHGGYAQEIWADAALGTVDSVELLQFGIYREIKLEGWYNMLNTGYRFPAAAACDYPPCRMLADSRTYVYSPTKPGMPEWIAGATSGRSFFSTGPLVLLEVEGEKPGGRIHKTGGGPHRVKARLRVRCEITPVTDVDLIVNGRVVEHRSVPRTEGQGRWIELERELSLTESSWIAARAYSAAPINQPDAEAHTNPVFVYLNNRAPFQRAAVDAWVSRIDEQIATHTKRQFPERARVLAYFQRARDFLLAIREQGGLAADVEPRVLAEKVALAPAGGRDLAADGSITNPSDAELKAFLTSMPPKRPDEALATFETAPGFSLQLVAAEPMVYDPVAAAFDEDGNLYVAEMRDYPYNTNQPVKVAWQQNRPKSDGKPVGSVRFLRDTDGDGRFDRSEVFADGLLWAGGIQPWKGGVFVASAPDIWYLKDTDGDGRADLKQKVFTGFGVENQQGIVNSLIYALDHRIYGSSSVNGGMVRRPGEAEAKAVPLKGRDFRFEPESFRLEPQTGTKQFGMSFDDWGNRFLCTQSQPAWHVVLPLQYLERNPHFTPSQTIFRTTPTPTPVHRISAVERWRYIRSSRRLTEGIRAADSEGVSHHVVDAGAGVTVYRGGAYPKEYYGNLFIGDSVSNLVHRRLIVPAGATFKTESADRGTEFVRSSDTWFRPVNFVNAPDGTLYCLDMAREHSETINIPADVEKHLDLTSGHDRGRIYRIAPPGFRSPPPPRLGRATTAELVAALESPHGWWRDTAHRLIHERQDKSVVPTLEHLALRSESPQARLHALWSLQGLQALGDRLIVAALADPHPGVRENAVRLAEPRLEASAELRDRVGALISDVEPRVRLQVAFAIGESRRWDQVALLARLAHENVDEPWIQSAILSSAAGCGGGLFAALAGVPAMRTEAAGIEFLRQLAVVIGAQNRPADVKRAVDALAGLNDLAVVFPVAVGLGEGLERGGASLRAADSRGRIMSIFRRAPQLAADASQPPSLRRTAVASLALLPYADAAPELLALLAPQQPPELQLAAIEVLGRFREPQVGGALLERSAGLSRDARKRALDAVIGRGDRLPALWTALERRVLHPSELSASQVNALRRHRDERVRERAAQFLGAAGSTARPDVYASYLPALQIAGDAGRGQAHFENLCAACHRFSGLGHDFGPNLQAARSGGKEKLLTSILDPNREVLPQFFICTVETRDGETIVGFVESESATSVTLRQPGGLQRIVSRDRITSMKTQHQSLMPEGLESGLTPEDMADLIAFLFKPVG